MWEWDVACCPENEKIKREKNLPDFVIFINTTIYFMHFSTYHFKLAANNLRYRTTCIAISTELKGE